jgi:hypothetical protein
MELQDQRLQFAELVQLRHSIHQSPKLKLKGCSSSGGLVIGVE